MVVVLVPILRLSVSFASSFARIGMEYEWFEETWKSGQRLGGTGRHLGIANGGS